MAGERRSIDTVHVYWEPQSPGHLEGCWYIETRHADGDVVQNSRREGWDGPPPQRYQKQEAEKLRAALQTWEPEARVIIYEEGQQTGGSYTVRVW